MQQGGSQYRRLVASFQRIFGATIFFGTDAQNECATVVHRARFNFMTEARIWYSRDGYQKLLPGDCQNMIVLSDEFYHEIQNRPIPADLEAAKALRRRRQRSISTCGFLIDASPRKEKSGCRCTGNSGS